MTLWKWLALVASVGAVGLSIRLILHAANDVAELPWE